VSAPWTRVIAASLEAGEDAHTVEEPVAGLGESVREFEEVIMVADAIE
jgi:hypothetical protein